MTGRSRVGIAIVLLMGAFALCTLASYAALLRQTPGGTDAIAMDASRLRSLRESLPTRGVVGYLSDGARSLESDKAYYLTQYYLAPVVVARDAAHEVVIANFTSRSAMTAAAVRHGLLVKRDYSNGVALLCRRSP